MFWDDVDLNKPSWPYQHDELQWIAAIAADKILYRVYLQHQVDWNVIDVITPASGEWFTLNL